jgi:hypothetical protein
VESSYEFGNEPSGFHKMLGNYSVASQLVASRVVLSYIEFVSYSVHVTETDIIISISYNI